MEYNIDTVNSQSGQPLSQYWIDDCVNQVDMVWNINTAEWSEWPNIENTEWMIV